MDASRGRLLVVDDDAQNRDLLVRRLQRGGFEVLQADCGLRALEILDSDAVDLVLLDVMMPVMGGVEVLRAVRSRRGPDELPVLMVSADGASERVVEALGAGANDYLTRPVDFPVALARIESQLRNRRVPAAVSPFRGLPGELLGPYRIEDVLGEGGMGQVYRARDTRLERTVALKVLPADMAPDPEHVARFMQEARIMARLDHPQVVPVWDVGSKPVPYFAMELVEGRDLDRILAQGVLAPRRAATIARDAARALHAVHQAGIVHRDLKPGNLLLDASGTVRLVDFGISRLVDADVRLTQPGCTMGTPAYMAPEQVDRALGEADARTDVYALGLLLYEMLVGDVPFRHEGLAGMLREIVFGNPMSPRKACPEVPPALDRVCLRATERKPDRRYPTAEAMADDLDLYLLEP